MATCGIIDRQEIGVLLRPSSKELAKGRHLVPYDADCVISVDYPARTFYPWVSDELQVVRGDKAVKLSCRKPARQSEAETTDRY